MPGWTTGLSGGIYGFWHWNCQKNMKLSFSSCTAILFKRVRKYSHYPMANLFRTLCLKFYHYWLSSI